MDTYIFKTPMEVDSYASKLVRNQLVQRKNSAFCFAGGNTTKTIYKKIVSDFQNEPDAFHDAKAFVLDEYWGVPNANPAGVAGRLKAQILDPVGSYRKT